MTKFTKIFVAAFLVAGLAFTSVSAYTHTTTLKYGSRGSQVMSLQQTLNMTSCKVALSGVGSMGFETTTFGLKTKAAVQCFQAANGLTADGIVGPMTGSKLQLVVVSSGSNSGNFPAGCTSAAGYSATTGQPCYSSSSLPAGCTSTVGYSPTTGAPCSGTPSNNTGGALTGGAGSVEEYDTLGSPSNNQDVGEGQDNVKVLGFSVEADESSDLNIKSVKIELGSVPTSPASDDFDDYATKLSIWYGSTKVAEVNASEFNDDNDYTKTISLSSDAIVRKGQTGSFYVAISAQDNIDSDDLGETWTVDVTSVRFVDAQGAVITDAPTTIDARTFTFESFSTANDIELKLTEATDSPDSQVILADDNASTDNVTLLKGKLKAEGSDIDVTGVTVAVTKSGTGDIDEIASQFTLKIDGNEVDSLDSSDGTTTVGGATACTTQTTCYFEFDDIDVSIDEGDTVDVEVLVDVNEIDGTTVAEGDSLSASIDADNIDAEDESGEDLGTGDLSGTISGDSQGFYTEGITVKPGATTATAQSVDGAGNDYGTFTIKFSVTAIGDDVYLDKTVASSTSTSTTPSGANRVAVLDSSNNNLTGSAVLSSSDSDATEMTNTYKIAEGATADFTLTVSSSANPDADIRAILYALEWGDADTATGDSVYNFDMGINGDYKTNYVHVQD